ncbi:MAG: IS1634 family transposase [Bacteroidales bacterium]|nr:IS1634 family transposase [Bacteroidales bacterium]
MFVRVKKIANTNRSKIQLVQTFRRSGKVVQKVYRHIGTAHNDMELTKLKELAEIIKEQEIEKTNPRLFSPEELDKIKIKNNEPINVNLKQLREEQRIITGIHQIYGQLYDEVGFNKIFSKQRISKKVIKDLVLARLAKPMSKKSTLEYLSQNFGINYKLEQIYRALDRIDDEAIDRIQEQSLFYTKSLFEEELNLIFYDCTTLYFESFTQDELKSFGYSKDHKFNQSQVLMALAVTKEGLPVGYELFAGNFYEGHTLQIVVEKLKGKLNIKRMILVADSGLFNKTNIEYLIKNNIEFIVGARLKNLSKKWQNQILDSTDYLKRKKKEDTLRIYDFEYSDSLRLIVSHSEKRAEKDKKDREQAIEKLKKRIKSNKNAKSLISNYGYQKYIQIEGESKVSVNQEKIAEVAQWDGLHGILTNVKDLKAEKLLEQYHGLWQVEESFRIHKHDLLIRPIFHWTAKRIKAHIAMVYMSFSLIRFLQHKLNKKSIKLSPEKVRNELCHAQESLLKHTITKDRYIIPSKPTENIKRIYSLFKKKYDATPCKLNK